MSDARNRRIGRRRFLRGAASLGLILQQAEGPGGNSAASGNLEQGGSTGGPKTALCTIAFQDRPLNEVLELAAKARFDGVEPWGKPDHLPLTSEDNRVREVKRKLDSLGLACSQYGSYVRLGDDKPAAQQKDDMARSIEIARMLGTRIIRIWAGAKNSDELSSGEWNRIVSDAVQYCGMAEPTGILLAMEMHGNTLTNRAAAMLELIRRVNRPCLKANFQILANTEDSYERAEKAGPHVVMCHAQNVSTTGKELPLISEGVVDFRRIYRILRKFGFDGFFEVEFVRGKTFEEKVDALKRDCAYLRTLGQ
jgi:sugar phosphate isomerase/epimerase